MLPIIKQLTSEGYAIEEIDVDQREELARRYSVSSLPTIVILHDTKEIKRHVGVISAATLRKSLQTLDYITW